MSQASHVSCLLWTVVYRVRHICTGLENAAHNVIITNPLQPIATRLKQVCYGSGSESNR